MKSNQVAQITVESVPVKKPMAFNFSTSTSKIQQAFSHTSTYAFLQQAREAKHLGSPFLTPQTLSFMPALTPAKSLQSSSESPVSPQFSLPDQLRHDHFSPLPQTDSEDDDFEFINNPRPS